MVKFSGAFNNHHTYTNYDKNMVCGTIYQLKEIWTVWDSWPAWVEPLVTLA